MNQLLIAFVLLLFISPIRAQNSKADSLFAVGQYAIAIQLYEEIAENNTKNNYQIGKAYYQLGNRSQAERYYHKAFKTDSTFLKAGLSYGLILRQNHKYAKADSLFTDLSKRYPDNPNFQYELGVIKELEKDSSGIKQFQKTLQLNPNHQNALYYASAYNYKKHQYDAVEALGKQALKNYPENIPMLRLLAKNANRMGDIHLAIARYKKITEDLQPESKDYKNLGDAYYKVYDFKNAIEAFKKVIEEEGEPDIEILYNLGLLYQHEGKYKKAEESFTTALAMKKMGLDKQYQSLASVYKSMGNNSLAIQYFKQALAENPTLIRAQYEMAVCADNYYKDLKTIRHYYQLIVDKFKENKNAKQFVELSKYRIKELDKKIFLKAEE